LALAGASDESLLGATLRRLGPLFPLKHTFVLTAGRLREATLAAAPGLASSHVLCEPLARNTAAAVGWGTSVIARTDPGALIGVFPSDHFIGDEAEYRYILTRALEAASQEFLVTVGIVPTRPETGYGYIRRGDELAPGVFRADRFVEKPVRPVAESYVESGKYVWNAGMFFFRASVMLEALRTFAPEIAAGLRRLDQAAAAGREDAILSDVFQSLPSISIDHAVMEKAKNVVVIPGEFGWNDVGSWQSAWELAPKDSGGNVLPPNSVAHDALGNLVVDLTTERHRRTHAIVGIRDMVVVLLDDALLILPKERSQDVRAVVDALRARGDVGAL
jgi:mannose-1-phosphate guanylyltransferase